MKRLASVFFCTLLALGVVYFVRSREMQELPARRAFREPPVAVSVLLADKRVEPPVPDLLTDAPASERLARLLAQKDRNLNEEDVRLLLALTEVRDADVIAALARTAASLKFDGDELRRLCRALQNLTKELPDAQAAEVLLALSPISQESRRDLKERIRPWFLNDPAGCAGWLSEAIDGGGLASFSESDRTGMAGFVRLGNVLSDPMSHLDAIRSMHRSEQKMLVTEGMKRVASAEDRRTLAGIGMTSGSPAEMPAILGNVVEDSGVEESAKWLADLPLPDEPRRAAALAALATGIKGNPDTARNADEILSVLKSDQQSAFAAALVKEWAVRDHEAAAGWINRNGGAPWQDSAREEFSRGVLTSGEPRAALLWAASIGDPARRSAVAQELFLNWKGGNPVAAREFLQSAECPADLAQALKQDADH